MQLLSREPPKNKNDALLMHFLILALDILLVLLYLTVVLILMKLHFSVVNRGIAIVKVTYPCVISP